MVDEFKTTIGQIATFMICAQAIAHFRPREAYAKYLRILLSVMILVQIFQPFCGLFWGISGQELYAGVEAFQQELDKSMAAALEQSALAGTQLESMSLLEVQERLAEQEKQSEAEVMEPQGEVDGISSVQTDGQVNVQINRIEKVEVEKHEE